ncbi:unnamed protein product [Protopolystoma xenopodis]|uniref:Uncharacterized protein n=1 Tax=Protopolystoma xenopodis TaxID=117903 RepID=A0A448WF95_9PLAT|nr:unnamed protein product [Protopolystoma xenopodis]
MYAYLRGIIRPVTLTPALCADDNRHIWCLKRYKWVDLGIATWFCCQGDLVERTLSEVLGQHQIVKLAVSANPAFFKSPVHSVSFSRDTDGFSYPATSLSVDFVSCPGDADFPSCSTNILLLTVAALDAIDSRAIQFVNLIVLRRQQRLQFLVQFTGRQEYSLLLVLPLSDLIFI